jgi:hypothetical protein
MNTMPFRDGSQEVPRSLLVALPEFRLNPLNGRTAPNSATEPLRPPSPKRTSPRPAPLTLPGHVLNHVPGCKAGTQAYAAALKVTGRR